MTAPKEIPSNLLSRYTCNGKIPIAERYFDESGAKGSYVWANERIRKLVAKARNRENMGYGRTTPLLYDALDIYPVHGQRVLVVGSKVPTYECILHAFGATPVTIDYKPIQTDVFTTHTEWAGVGSCAAALSVSSIEHSGLGRYGDRLDPEGDIKAMQDIRDHVPNGGLLYLSVPVGADALVWNAHRIYGPLRLPMLVHGWEWVDGFGLAQYGSSYMPAQPVLVLRRSE